MRVFCNDWDSYKPQALTDVRTGQSLGVLQPRITLDVLRASPAISDKSIPEFDERDLDGLGRRTTDLGSYWPQGVILR